MASERILQQHRDTCCTAAGRCGASRACTCLSTGLWGLASPLSCVLLPAVALRAASQRTLLYVTPPNYTVGSSNHFQINDVAACCSLQAASRRTLPPLIQASLHNFGSSSRLHLNDLAACFSPFCIAGSIKAHFAAFDPSKPLPHFPVAFLGSALSVPQYQRQLLPAQQQQQQGAGAGAIALAAGVARGVADGNATVVVSALIGINMSVSAILPLIVGGTAALPCEHSRDR